MAAILPDAPALSPTKPNGILMTPGTTRRNKTVSFDKDTKNQGRNGVANTSSLGDGLPQSASITNRAPTKLTAQLQEVRNSAQKAKTNQMQRAKDDTDLTMDYLEPRSQSGKYWKREYESYAENTQREMKKLVIKQKAAKDYAKEKEQEVVGLQTQLRQERQKVEKLEAKTKELAAQMKEFERRMMGQKSGVANSPKRKTPKAAAPGDLWANAAFSSPFVDDAAERDQSPLRARDMNIQGQTPKDGKPKAVKSAHTKRPSEDTMDMSLPLPSPESVSRTTPRSSRKSTADLTIDELVEKYSPEKPQFDRLALPLGVGALNFGSNKPEMKSTADLPKTGARIASMSDERLAKAKARIEARKLSKLAAV